MIPSRGENAPTPIISTSESCRAFKRPRGSCATRSSHSSRAFPSSTRLISLPPCGRLAIMGSGLGSLLADIFSWKLRGERYSYVYNTCPVAGQRHPPPLKQRHSVFSREKRSSWRNLSPIAKVSLRRSENSIDMADDSHPKICVLGLDCAAPEIVFGDRRLKNLHRLMSAGTWGRLESVIPPITVPAWMCMATSQDPGSLGVYCFRNRANRTYG